MATSTNLKEKIPADLAPKVQTPNNIQIEAWGGSGGNYWDFKPNAKEIQITIAYGVVIDSLTLTSLRPDGSVETKIKVGGTGGDRTSQVNITGTSEYLTGIMGTYGEFKGSTVIRSIRFQTNLNTYGPFGSTDGSPFHFVMEDGGKIVGFHGRYGWFIDAIGVYVSPM